VDEPDTAIAQKKKKGKEKKVKPGVLFREEVRLMRDVNDGGSQKRKAPSESHRCVLLERSKSITDMSLRTDHQLPRRRSRQFQQACTQTGQPETLPFFPNPSRINALHQQVQSLLKPTAAQHPVTMMPPISLPMKTPRVFRKGAWDQMAMKLNVSWPSTNRPLQKDFAFGYFPLYHNCIYA
jgi:hypothetical protein